MEDAKRWAYGRLKMYEGGRSLTVWLMNEHEIVEMKTRNLHKSQ